MTGFSSRWEIGFAHTFLRQVLSLNLSPRHDRCLEDRRTSIFPIIFASRMVGWKPFLLVWTQNLPEDTYLLRTIIHVHIHACIPRHCTCMHATSLLRKWLQAIRGCISVHICWLINKICAYTYYIYIYIHIYIYVYVHDVSQYMCVYTHANS
jgi:hypothetical protein